MSFIEIDNLTKDYGNGRGIFNINLSIKEGEVFGFVGTNGSGKTTTIRHLMGFLKPQSGSVKINGLDCWKDAAEVKKLVGYIPGEISFPDAPTGTDFLKRQAELLNLEDFTYMNALIKKLQLDPTANLKRMSKGMKQKTAIIAALMADPKVLILDEPTTGLDPLMRTKFVEILKEERKKGKTIFMSSHMFDEVEQVCHKVAMIKDGKMIAVKSTADIKYNQNKEYIIEFSTKEGYERFRLEAFDIVEEFEQNNQVAIKIHDREINTLFAVLKGYDIQSISERKYSLAQYFNSLY